MAELLPVWVRAIGESRWHIAVRVSPGARRNEILGEAEGRLRISLTAPAVDNKANKALLAFVADKLNLRPRELALVRGDGSRQKIVEICAPEPDWTGLAPTSPRQ